MPRQTKKPVSKAAELKKLHEAIAIHEETIATYEKLIEEIRESNKTLEFAYHASERRLSLEREHVKAFRNQCAMLIEVLERVTRNA